jgi:hypothetical protein
MVTAATSQDPETARSPPPICWQAEPSTKDQPTSSGDNKPNNCSLPCCDRGQNSWLQHALHRRLVTTLDRPSAEGTGTLSPLARHLTDHEDPVTAATAREVRGRLAGQWNADPKTSAQHLHHCPRSDLAMDRLRRPTIGGRLRHHPRLVVGRQQHAGISSSRLAASEGSANSSP